MEAIRISCAGFPTRKPFAEFIERFKVLAPEVTKLRWYIDYDVVRYFLLKLRRLGNGYVNPRPPRYCHFRDGIRNHVDRCSI